MLKITDAVFVTTATKASQWPREPLPEIAFVGRSNVGKSSMINTLANRNKLVRVSNTPGRTRTLNFFDVSIDSHGKKRTVRLCDLPGYGFAKVSKAEREQWHEMISEYLSQRRQLSAVVSIVDAEVGPTGDDVSMLDFLQGTPPKILVVATKLDRLSKAKQKPALHKVAAVLEVPGEAVVGFSAVDRTGVNDVWNLLLATVDARGAR